MIAKSESRRIRSEIRRVLLTVWDPIGVKDAPNAQDEYDSYVFPVFELVTQAKSDEAIVKYLLEIVNDSMGLGSAKESDMLPTLRALREIPIAKTE
jgi:hypothetical protein